MKKSALLVAFLLLCGCAGWVGAQSAPLAAAPAIVVERNAVMRTRDGVKLHADVYRPAVGGKYPVLLTRTPYDKRNMAPIGEAGARRGFIVVAQDVRGRYTSEGEWYPFRHEIDDGYDTVEWAAGLAGSDGRVGMFSGSYLGATQMLAAMATPPHLAGICPIITASNYHENWTYQGGAFEQWFDESWTAQLSQDVANRLVTAQTKPYEGVGTLPLEHYELFDVKNLPTRATLTETLAPYYLDWLRHPDYDAYWKQWSIEENYAKIAVPALVVGAWYDIFQGGSLRNYQGIRAGGGSAAAREKTQLVVAVGGHAGWGRTVGERDFGATAAFSEEAIILDWYAYLFQGAKNQFADGNHARYFEMGTNRWREAADWPLAQAHPVRYFLHSAGAANTAAGDGLLSTSAATGAADSFVYDPADPAPTTGGPLCCGESPLGRGPRDQRKVEERRDVLVYTSEPLAADTEVAGPVTLDLFAASSAVDTDFTAKLVDVLPDGTAYNLTEGILRASYRGSTKAAPVPLEPGRVYEYTIDLWSTGNVFLKGHRIRVEVSSSNFPRFDRNLNTGQRAATSATFVKAANTVLHDAAHPSALVLPVVTR